MSDNQKTSLLTADEQQKIDAAVTDFKKGTASSASFGPTRVTSNTQHQIEVTSGLNDGLVATETINQNGTKSDVKVSGSNLDALPKTSMRKPLLDEAKQLSGVLHASPRQQLELAESQAASVSKAFRDQQNDGKGMGRIDVATDNDKQRMQEAVNLYQGHEIQEMKANNYTSRNSTNDRNGQSFTLNLPNQELSVRTADGLTQTSGFTSDEKGKITLSGDMKLSAPDFDKLNSTARNAVVKMVNDESSTGTKLDDRHKLALEEIIAKNLLEGHAQDLTAKPSVPAPKPINAPKPPKSQQPSH